MDHMLKEVWFGNTVQSYIFAVTFLIVGWVSIGLIKVLLLTRLKRWAENTATTLDDLVVHSIRKAFVPLAYVSVLLGAVKSLALPSILSKLLAILWASAVMIVVVNTLLGILRHLIFEVWIKRRPDQVMMERHMRSIMPFIHVAIWGLGTILLLDNLGFKVTAIMAGLGIGGVAVALAAQAVLGDLFSYVAIMLDKPFELDDAIQVGDFNGTIEHIGIKTTRLRSLSGEQIIMANKDLTDSRVRNYKRQNTRRVELKLGVTYDTPNNKLQRAIQIVKDLLQKTPDVKMDRVHFAKLGDWSLGIEAVYIVSTPDYGKHMDIQQSLFLAIKEAYEKEGIQFAFPTQTVQNVAVPTTASTN